MTVSVFVGTSVDGFIARANGALDWLPAGGGEPHGYDEFIASVDAIVIGRNTFETVLAFETWPYAGKRVVVLSSRPVDLSTAKGVVEQMGGTPAEIVARLAASGARHLYVEGLRCNDSCARGSSSGLSSPAYRCSSEMESLSSAPCRETCGSATWRLGITRAAWSRASTMSRRDQPVRFGR